MEGSETQLTGEKIIVGDMPGAVPRSGTITPKNATIRCGFRIEDEGLEKSCKNPVINAGVNCCVGGLTNKSLAEAHGYNYSNPETLI